MNMDKSIDSQFIAFVRTCALRGIYDGLDSPENWRLIKQCKHVHYPSGTRLIYTRDGDFHASGWIKNPAFSRCWHLSLSFFDPVTGEDTPQRRNLADLWCKLLLGRDHMRRLLVESPASAAGKRKDVWHYRLFTDTHWRPVTLTGEPYHTLKTETGWRSWSEIHDQSRLPVILPAGVE